MSIAEKLTTVAENVPKVYEAGQTAERELLWDSMLRGTVKTNLFSYWNTEAFYPTRDIVLTGSSFSTFSMFGTYNGVSQNPINLKQRLEECGVTFDVSGVTNANYMFSWATFTHLPVIDLSSATSMRGTFQGGNILVYIEKLILSPNGTSVTDAFNTVTALKEIRIEGLIIKDFDIKKAPLTAESAKSIINHLKNYAGTDEELTYKLSFLDTVWTTLNESEPPPSEDTWEEYVNSLGWLI